MAKRMNKGEKKEAEAERLAEIQAFWAKAPWRPVPGGVPIEKTLEDLLEKSATPFHRIIGFERYERIAHQIVVNALADFPDTQFSVDMARWILAHCGVKTNKPGLVTFLAESIYPALGLKIDIELRTDAGDVAIEVKLDGDFKGSQLRKYERWRALPSSRRREVILVQPRLATVASEVIEAGVHLLSTGHLARAMLEALKDYPPSEATLKSKEFDALVLLLEGISCL